MARDLFAEAGISPTNEPRDLFAEAGIVPEQEPAKQDFAERMMAPMRGQEDMGALKGGLLGAAQLATNIAKPLSIFNPWSDRQRFDETSSALKQFEKENESLRGFSTGKLAAQVSGTAGIPISQSANIAERVLSGAAGGALAGMAMEGEEGIGPGAVIGGAFPVAVSAAIKTGKYIGKRVGEIADLVLPGGAKRIADRYVNVIVGDNNKDILARELAKSEELVAGSKPTAAEAVANLPEGSPIIAHQKLVSQEPGGISAEFGKRLAEKQTARETALSFAGTEDQIKNLITERTNAVKPLYEEVKKSTSSVRTIPVLHKVDKILSENINRDAIATPMKKIRDALVINTERGTKLESNPQNLKSLSDQIGDMMGKKTPTGQPEYDVKVLREIKESLDDQIGEYVPEFKKAQEVFAEKSKPINVMQIGQSLKEKLYNPTGAETPGTYLRALNEEKKLLKESIGFGRKGIEEYLSPEQMKSVEGVAKDLERQVASKKPLQPTELRGGINVAAETTLSLPNLLSRPAMLANYVIKSAGRNVEPEIDKYLSHLYRNPKELAKVLKQVPETQKTQFYKEIVRYGRAPAISAATQNETQGE